MEVLYALHRLCFSQYAAGDWSAVRRSADEAVSLARSIGQPAQTGTPLAWLALLAALQGRDDYDDLLDGATALLAAHRLGVMDGFVADVLRWARAVHAAHAGDAAESLHHFTQMHDGVLARLAAVPRITAAVQASRRRPARRRGPRRWSGSLRRARCRGRRRSPATAAPCWPGRARRAAAVRGSLRHHAAARPSLRRALRPAGLRRAPPARRATRRRA